MKDCIFCQIRDGSIPANKVYEDSDILAFLDIKPINPGHALVLPKKHFENIFDMPRDLLSLLLPAVRNIAKGIQTSTGADGINIGMNNGKFAGQVVNHAHIHIMPRFKEDGYKLWTGKNISSEELAVLGDKIRKKIATS